MSEGRLKRIRTLMKDLDLDGILVWDPTNVRYISGFTGTEGTLLITSSSRYFLTDSRYTEQAKQQARSFRKIIFKEKIPAVVEQVKKLGIKKLGFEGNFLTFLEHRKLSHSLKGVKLVPIDKQLDHLRLIKDPAEVAAIERSIRAASEGFLAATGRISAGVRERDVALDLEIESRKRGAEAMSFDTIVASGFRGALPHGVASDKKIRAGELVVIDWGVVVGGYASDETQTVAVSRASTKERDLYDVVRKAHDLAIEAVKPGITFKEVDSIARDVIANAGYGKYFGHGLGHGVGLLVHEDPRINPLATGEVQAGMVFTVEPGIYLPGWGGVRIEDMILVTRSGCRMLSILDKDLRIL